ncbi:MAG: ATP-binding protein [Pseudomonadota bacterium]
MSVHDARAPSNDPIVDRTERGGNVALLLLLAAALVAGAAFIATMPREQAEPYILGFLGLLAAIGVLALFAGATGLLRFVPRKRQATFAHNYLDTMEDGVLIADESGRTVYANRAYGSMTGARSGGDIRSIERVFSGHADASESVFRLSQAAREGVRAEEEIRMEHPLDNPDGEPRWYRVRVRPLVLNSSETADAPTKGRTLTVWRTGDITKDRYEQENSFQELQRAINFLDHSPVGFLSVDGNGKVIYLNATLSDWVGFDLASFDPGRIPLERIIDGDGSALITELVGQPGQVLTESFDLDLISRSQKPIPVRVLHRVPFDNEGRAGASRTVVLNRSAGAESSETVRAAEVRFARFFNNTPIAIASVNSDGRIGRTNAPFARLFGSPTKNEFGQFGKLIDVVAGDGKLALEAALTEARDGKSSIPPVDAAFGPENNRFVRFYVSAVSDMAEAEPADGGGETAIVYALDTTEQRGLEAQFAQSQKMQAIGQLAGGVAHDFNNVLTAIIGFSDLLLANHRPTDPSFQDIMNIKQNANRAAGLVRQLLAFSRRQTLRPTELALTDTLSDLSILLDRLLGEKVELAMSHGRDLWPVMADVNQLEQVIINLAVNARDAMPGGGKLTIATKNVLADEALGYKAKALPEADHVLIEVTDTGTGMPPEVLEKIFDPFFTTKEVGKGTGLGLSTVYGIVKQTGGYVYAESEPEKGTMFRIFLPRHIPEEKPEPEKKPEAAVAQDLTGSASILLVEDEEAVRAFAARALTSRGYTVHEASSGADALDVMEETDGAVDLVVSDVVMPEMDGPSLLRELRKTRPDLKIIFVSGYAEEAFSKNLPENEKFHFLPKPFSLKQLATTVKEVLGS